MDMNVIGALNEGADQNVLEERAGVYFLTPEGERSIDFIVKDIKEFLSNKDNILDYLSLVNPEKKSEYEYDTRIIDAIESRKNNRFVNFLLKNSEKIMSIARTTRHTGSLIALEISAYIRQFCKDNGYLEAVDRKWVFKQNVY